MRVPALLLAFLILGPSVAHSQVAGKKAAAAVGAKVDWLNLGSIAEMYKNALSLSPSQFETIKDLSDKSQYQISRNLEEMKEALVSVDAERVKDDPDLTYIRVTLTKHGKLAVENEMLRFQFPFACRDVLNPDQMAKWKTIRLMVETRMRAIRETTPGKKGDDGANP